jgi:spore maturation protein A
VLNKVWAGLIILSILFALGHDLRDLWTHRYHNGAVIALPYTPGSTPDTVRLAHPDGAIDARLRVGKDSSELVFPVSEQLPTLWREIAQHQYSRNKEELRAKILRLDRAAAELELVLPTVYWVKVRAVTVAAFDMASFAVKLAIGLVGIMALWLGLMRIAEHSGLVQLFVRSIRPLLGWLFPDVPKDHPALGSISLNLATNVLGLGNASTPLGIRAMQQLQELNDNKDRASHAMCMFLALNTSSVQLLPPVTLIALMGIGVSELFVPILLATSASTVAAVIAAKTYARLRSNG